MSKTKILQLVGSIGNYVKTVNGKGPDAYGNVNVEGSSEGPARCITIALPDNFDFTTDSREINIADQVADIVDTLLDDAESGVPVYLTGTDSTGTYRFRLSLNQVFHGAGESKIGFLTGLLLNPRDSNKIASVLLQVTTAALVEFSYIASVGTDESLMELLTTMTMGNTKVRIVRSGQTITITETLENGEAFVTVLNQDENDWPKSITANGKTVPVEWSGFDG